MRARSWPVSKNSFSGLLMPKTKHQKTSKWSPAGMPAVPFNPLASPAKPGGPSPPPLAGLASGGCGRRRGPRHKPRRSPSFCLDESRQNFWRTSCATLGRHPAEQRGEARQELWRLAGAEDMGAFPPLRLRRRARSRHFLWKQKVADILGQARGLPASGGFAGG